ncbi:DUF5677 domain-containing protein [Bacillus pumilus]|uniref:DUF5677 domain-containing protein n=1 Tax=Bacillus pumilus TaxID=1408 RepID=UPI001B3A46CC|nr:DUF5677 domain-containing protein [Bacillus pumilus]MBQ4816895.1 hypothetical protein [Bacillus pumilus]WIG32734.1 DUF5677 domain-containing protein [Bacillus pumilus]
MNHSKLSDHKFDKGKFITPWNEFLNELGRENSWFYGRLPEYLWLALIIDFYGRKDGLRKCYNIIKKLAEKKPDLFSLKFSNILDLDCDVQNKMFEYILSIIDVRVLAPLTAIFTYSNSPSFASKFQTELSIGERIELINSIMKKTSDHQTNLSTDVRFVVLYYNLLSGKLHIPKETLQLLLDYPNLSHEDEKMRTIRPLVRSMEIVPVEIDPYNEGYLDIFWESVSRMSDCELFYIEHAEEVLETKEYIDQVKTVLQYYKDLLVSISPLDDKMMVLLGIATYSYKRLLELVEHDLFNTISGRSIVRVLIEDFIMMKYLIQNESTHNNIWTEYQYYGIGQYKLIVERYLQSGKTLTNSHVSYDYMDFLVNEYKNKEFIDMDTTYFNKQNVRGKAISVDEKDLFDFFYDYDSAFEHGLWGAIRESSLIKCNTPSHQYHCVPDIENNQKMKSVWNDCVHVMNKTLELLEEIYGIPSSIKRSNER